LFKQIRGDPPSKVTRNLNRSYERFCGRWSSRERGRGQFLQTCEPESLQERLRCGEVQAAVSPRKFLHKLEIAERHDKTVFVGVEEAIDFRLEIGCLKAEGTRETEIHAR
jgi:hypothetical protein